MRDNISWKYYCRGLRSYWPELGNIVIHKKYKMHIVKPYVWKHYCSVSAHLISQLEKRKSWCPQKLNFKN